MAHSFSTNNTPTTGSIAMFQFLSTLVAAGHVKTQDSDGTTYSPAGTQVTSGNAGANGLANTNAWFVLQAPAVAGQQRSFCFQRGTVNNQWRVKYSYAAGFVGGAPDAVTVPSATDEQVLYGGGTDAAPTFQALLGGDGTYTFNVCGGDTTVKYSWYWMAWLSGNPDSGGRAMMLDVMADGSFSTLDVDPAVVYRVATSGSTDIFRGNDIGHYAVVNSFGYYKVGGVPTWLGTQMWNITDNISGQQEFGPYGVGNAGIAAGISANTWDGNDDGVPGLYGRPKVAGTANGFKGMGLLLRMMGVFRANGDTLSLDGGVKNFIWIHGVALPWDGSSPIL